MWNYRILRYDSGEVGIHEVYYDDKGNPENCTQDPVGIVGDDVEELRDVLAQYGEAFKKPILDFSFFTAKGDPT